jgi:glycogen debranching enzyme
MTPNIPLQPAIHHLVCCVQAPSVTLSEPHGQINGVGAEGFYLGERRLLCQFALTAMGRAPELVHSVLLADGTLPMVSMVRDGSEPTPDPSVLLHQTRHQRNDGFEDSIVIKNVGPHRRHVSLALHLASDLAPTSTIKAGLTPPQRLVGRLITNGIEYSSEGYAVSVTAEAQASVDTAAGTLTWALTIEPGHQWETTIVVRGVQPSDEAFRPLPARTIAWVTPTVATNDASLALLNDWSFGDLSRLALGDPLAPDDTFIAAGCPWYFTLFGRDPLWTARLMLPFGTELAASTLRSLARRQGTSHNAKAAEQPGRIPHEVRPATLHDGDLTLPPVYYGSIDATVLWITTLAEAWRWGMSDADVTALLPALQRAVGWLLDLADPDLDGLCEYIDATGSGLTNQGWKDSGDSVHWRNGTLATAPIALVEVQGYAYEAAMNAVALYAHFGLDESDQRRAWPAFSGRSRRQQTCR